MKAGQGETFSAGVRRLSRPARRGAERRTRRRPVSGCCVSARSPLRKNGSGEPFRSSRPPAAGWAGAVGPASGAAGTACPPASSRDRGPRLRPGCAAFAACGPRRRDRPRGRGRPGRLERPRPLPARARRKRRRRRWRRGASARGASCSSGVSPRKRRVRCRFSGGVHRTEAVAGRDAAAGTPARAERRPAGGSMATKVRMLPDIGAPGVQGVGRSDVPSQNHVDIGAPVHPGSARPARFQAGVQVPAALRGDRRRVRQVVLTGADDLEIYGDGRSPTRAGRGHTPNRSIPPRPQACSSGGPRRAPRPP